jgi:hypothetical protein
MLHSIKQGHHQTATDSRKHAALPNLSHATNSIEMQQPLAFCWQPTLAAPNAIFKLLW